MKREFALLLFLGAGMAHAGSVPSEWKSRYATVLGEMRTKDLKGFESNFAPSFATYDSKGKKTDRATFFREIEDAFKGATKVETAIDLKSASGSATNMAVQFDFHLKITRGATGGGEMHEIGVDHWQKINGKWLFVKTVDSSMTMKPIAATKPMPKAKAQAKAN